MRIGINALYMIPGGVGGTEIYMRSLARAMAAACPQHDYIVFTNQETGLAGFAPGIEVVPQSVRASNRPARLLWEQTMLPAELVKRKIGVLLNPGFTAPLLAPCPQVTVFHDLQHKRHPEFFRWFDLPAWRLMLFASACLSDHLIAVSEATRTDLLRYYPVPPSRISVIPHGVEERLISLNRDPQPMLLCVSTLHPHKNLERLVRVFARFRAKHPAWKLILCGMRGFHAEPVERLIGELGITDGVRITGWVGREDLYELYRTAGAFVYPSLFEGFGMPVLEALAAGVPTACSDIEPLRQFDCQRFDPFSEEAMLDAIEGLVAGSQPRRDVSRYTWEAAARATVDVLVSAAGLPTAVSRRSSDRDI